MKKIASILLVALILLSGMHLSIATHICGGEISAVKWSFSGQKADCGMEKSTKSCTTQKSIHTNCCHNKISFFTTDNDYVPSSFHIEEKVLTISHWLTFPDNITTNLKNNLSLITNNNSLKKTITNAVNLAVICVFRI